MKQNNINKIKMKKNELKEIKEIKIEGTQRRDTNQCFGGISNDSGIDILQIPAGYNLEIFVNKR